VWCDDELFPRKLYVSMSNGQPNWRCACFKELGWNDLRQVLEGVVGVERRGAQQGGSGVCGRQHTRLSSR
jgi:hypothetical protein